MDMTPILIGPAPTSAGPSATPNADGAAPPEGDGSPSAFAALLARAQPEAPADDADAAPAGRRRRTALTGANDPAELADGPQAAWRGLEIDPERLTERRRALRGDPGVPGLDTAGVHGAADRAARADDLTLSPEMAQLLDTLEIAPRLAQAELASAGDEAAEAPALPDADPRGDVAAGAVDPALAAWVDPATTVAASGEASALQGLAGQADPAVRGRAAGEGAPEARNLPAVELRAGLGGDPRAEARGDARGNARAGRPDRPGAAGHAAASSPGAAAAAAAARSAKTLAEDTPPAFSTSATPAPSPVPLATGFSSLPAEALRAGGSSSSGPAGSVANDAAGRAGVLGASAPAPQAATAASASAEATVPFQAQLSAALESPAFVPALGVQLKTLVSEGIARAELQLHPAELGPIAVSISMDGNQAQVQLTVDNAATRETLQQALPQLSDALRDAGLSLGGSTVSQQPSSSGGQDPSSGRTAGPRGAGGRAGDSVDALAETAPRVAARPRGLLDLYA